MNYSRLAKVPLILFGIWFLYFGFVAVSIAIDRTDVNIYSGLIISIIITSWFTFPIIALVSLVIGIISLMKKQTAWGITNLALALLTSIVEYFVITFLQSGHY